MKPCRTAALALIGWYLMVPPTRYSLFFHGPDPRAPLAKWKIVRRFDSEAQCKKVKADNDEKSERQAKLENPMSIKVVSLGLCVASDDPRLQEIQKPVVQGH